MATAASYDQWADAGMAFTDEELKAYGPGLWAEERVKEVLDRWAVAHRKAGLPGIEAPKWWEDVSKKMLDVVSWYCVALALPGIDREALRDGLPTPSSAEGKALTKRALDATPDGFLGSWSADAEAQMRYVVTIGRACWMAKGTSGWKKATNKESNRLANCLMKEINLTQRLDQTLSSRSG